MPRLPLNKTLRETLKGLAGKLVACPAEERALAAAYKAAAPLVRAVVEKRNPPRDMRVLKKYEKAFPDSCIKLQLTAGGVEQFDFALRDAPLVASPTYRSPPYAADAATTEAVANWIAARSALKAARDRKLADYRTLVDSSRTLEEVAAIWPEAEKARPAKSNALIVLSPDVVKRIQTDVASRKSAA